MSEEVALRERELWLTAILRPVGELVGRALERFAASLSALAENTNLVVVDLAAAVVPAPEALAEALRRPAGLLSAPDRCLLLVGADPALLRALDQAGGHIATLTPAPA